MGTEGSPPAAGPRVSIVIPVYNGADYLGEAIDSALAQTYGNLEVVVVNDGSTDGGATERIARGYGDRIRYVAKPNGGVATALNAGIDAMTGDYFSWLSHDDLYAPDKVGAQVQALAGVAGDAVAYCAFEEFDPAGRVLRDSLSLPVFDDPAMAVLETVLHGCALLVPRRCFEVAGRFDPALRTTQDNDLWLRIALAGFPFHYVPRVLVRSRQHPGQGSRTIHTHAAERELWYRGAVDALGRDRRLRHAARLADLLLRNEHPRVFWHLLRRVRADGGSAAPLLAVLARRLPGLAAARGRRALRGLPGVVALKRRLLPA